MGTLGSSQESDNEITGIITKVIWYNNDTYFMIAKFLPAGKQRGGEITVKGVIMFPQEGGKFQLVVC